MKFTEAESRDLADSKATNYLAIWSILRDSNSNVIIFSMVPN